MASRYVLCTYNHCSKLSLGNKIVLLGEQDKELELVPRYIVEGCQLSSKYDESRQKKNPSTISHKMRTSSIGIFFLDKASITIFTMLGVDIACA